MWVPAPTQYFRINTPWIILSRMKSKLWFVTSGLMLVLGIVCIAWRWHGTASVNLGIPLSSTAVQFCGSASGGLALAGLGAMILSLLLLVIAIFRWLFGGSAQSEAGGASLPQKGSK